MSLIGIEGWKPVLELLIMPPMPFLVLALLGGVLLARGRRSSGWSLLLLALGGVWAMCSSAVGNALIASLTQPPPALSAARMSDLARSPKTAIVVLGAGRRPVSPEYGLADLTPLSMERLRYAVFLSRQTGLPLAFSGGVGHRAEPGATEADIARRIAVRDFGVRLRWTEDQSRDTNENAFRSLALLRAEGIERIVLVTHDFHMRRALAAFERALRREHAAITVVAAPMGLRAPGALDLTSWLPTGEGFMRTRLALHEWVGRLAGA